MGGWVDYWRIKLTKLNLELKMKLSLAAFALYSVHTTPSPQRSEYFLFNIRPILKGIYFSINISIYQFSGVEANVFLENKSNKCSSSQSKRRVDTVLHSEDSKYFLRSDGWISGYPYNSPCHFNQTQSSVMFYINMMPSVKIREIKKR